MSYQSMLSAGKQGQTHVNVKQLTLTADGQGGDTHTWTVIYRRLLARFNALTSKEIQMLHSKREVEANYSVYLEHVTRIKEGDRLVKVDDSREFDVKLIMDWDEDKQYMQIAVKEADRLE